jgi:peptide/nickel transport system substrate-binding protein
MKTRHLTRMTASLFAVALSGLVGCSAADSDAAYSGPPRSGGTLRLALDFDPVCLDPQQSALGQSLNIGRQVVDSLTDQDPKTGRTVPWLAKSWTVNDTATRFTFRLRDGVTFSDGAPLNASALKANFDAMHALGAVSARGAVYLKGYQKTTVVDARTATVAFERPNVRFLRATSTVSLGLLSPRSLARAPQRRCQGELAGSGPFTLGSYHANTSVTLNRRAGYTWGSPLWKHSGTAYLRSVEYRIVPESTTRSGSLASGQLDAATPVAPQDIAQFSGNGFRLLNRVEPGVVLSLYVNTARPAVNDPKVRQALQKAVDREAVGTAFLGSGSRAATSVLSSTTPHYTDLGAALAHDPAGARQLLDRAGWRAGPDQIRVKDGKRLSLEAIYVRQQSLELVQQQFKAVGVELRLRQLTVAQFTQALRSGSYDLTLQSATRSDPDVLTTVFADQSPVPDAALRARLNAASSSSDDRRRTADFTAAQRELVDEAYVLPVNEVAQTVAQSDKVRALAFDASNRILLHDTWLA